MPFLSKKSPTKMVAVAVPLFKRNYLTQDEEISLRHLTHYLGKYDTYFVMAKSVNVKHPGIGVKRFSDSYFGTREGYIRLMLSPTFYKAFREYKYVLTYQLDCLVFSDQLLEWCETDLDFVGAPWLKCEDTPDVTVPRVGNSGFSLKKVESFLKVIYSDKYWRDPAQYWANFCRNRSKLDQLLNFPRKYLYRWNRLNGPRREMANWHLRKERYAEDYFWSDEAIRYYPDFKIASVETGLRFAFEVAPRMCFELNNRQLPFGCHAWTYYDRSFWEPYLLK